MAARDSEEEKDAVDLVTEAMFSINFLDFFSTAVFDPKCNAVSIIDFYKTWLERTSARTPKIPFNLGIFVGYLYCGLLFTKENWSTLLPTEPISNVDPAWGLKGVTCLPSTNPDPPLPYFIRRIRNGLGHANLSPHVPEGITKDQVHDVVKWTFRDVNPKDPADVFEVTLTMRQLEQVVKTFQGLVHKHVRTKHGP